jgi:hypothetical protein
MVDNGVEQKGESQDVQKQIEQKVAAQTAEQLKAEMEKLDDRVKEVQKEIWRQSQKLGRLPQEFDGKKDDEGTLRGRANTVTEFIKKIFVAAKTAPEKVPAKDAPKQAEKNAPILTPESTKLIQKIGEKINIENISDQTAPYFYDLLKSITNGEIETAKDLDRALKKATPIQEFSPGMFEKLQNASVEYAINNFNTPEKDAKQMFGVEEQSNNIEEQMKNEKRAMEENSAKGSFRNSWQQYFSGFFDEGEDKKLIEALYTPRSFVEYYKSIQDDLAKKNNNLDVKALAQKASSEMEVKISLLFAKLYSRLDHESPKEYFQAIEQEDIMHGITPAKTELKRRISLLGHSLHEYEHELKEKGEEVIFFRRLEQERETISVEVDDKGTKKPRQRFKTLLKPVESSGGHFAHYLEQIADSYIEARRYTHNSRAIFLHPPDGQKGFYGQLSHFAAESSTLDFDQMMLLPDNDIFQSAFGLYNKMVEEGFAKNDWRHPAAMFTPELNTQRTPIESRILKQLKAMYDVSEDRLEAALTMAVGASRGLFLTEVEMAAHADPHLDEKGGATFTSYYNQDATALMAFNPQHLLARFAGGPNLLDPVFFVPLKGIEGSQGFASHHEMWDRAKKYKESYVSGRAQLPEKTFFDLLDNVGLVGGPMQRKGWRTAWQFDSLYIHDQNITTDSEGRTIKGPVKTNHFKTFKHMENIGYEVLQDFVSKFGGKIGDGDFLGARSIPKTRELYADKKALFEYIYEKYFDQDPKGLGKYMDKLRAAKRKDVIDSIRKSGSAPKDIDTEVETQASREFLDQMLARVITKRLPSKILRMDRDRYSKDGTSRYKQVMKDMGLDGQFDQFDDIMQDLILAEQMMRKDVSTKMREMQAAGKPRESYGDIRYEINEETIKQLLGPLISKKGSGWDQKRIDNVLRLYGHIKTRYSTNSDFIDKELVPHFKNGGAADRETKYTIALDETDLSFIPFRAGGQSVLKRAISDISSVEENVVKPITQLVAKLRDMGINGKKDFGPVIEIIQKTYSALDGIIGFNYANEMASRLASLTIMYMKKDTQARALMGLGGIGKYNSMVAEAAGKKVGVWEWDSADIDRFITALEARGLVPATPYNIAATPEPEPMYITIPFRREPVKLPEKIPLSNIANMFGRDDGVIVNPFTGKDWFKIQDIPLFQRRKANFHVWSKQLREKFGGTKSDMFFDIVNRYLPVVALFILWNLIKKAFDDSEGKKK